MKKNLSRTEALLRMLFGSLFFFFFVIGGPSWMGLGLYLMLSASFRFCIFFYYISGGTA